MGEGSKGKEKKRHIRHLQKRCRDIGQWEFEKDALGRIQAHMTMMRAILGRGKSFEKNTLDLDFLGALSRMKTRANIKQQQPLKSSPSPRKRLIRGLINREEMHFTKFSSVCAAADRGLLKTTKVLTGVSAKSTYMSMWKQKEEIDPERGNRERESRKNELLQYSTKKGHAWWTPKKYAGKQVGKKTACMDLSTQQVPTDLITMSVLCST